MFLDLPFQKLSNISLNSFLKTGMWHTPVTLAQARLREDYQIWGQSRLNSNLQASLNFWERLYLRNNDHQKQNIKKYMNPYFIDSDQIHEFPGSWHPWCHFLFR